MKKVNVLYFSNTGNTEEMANSVVEGAKQAGHEVKLIKFEDATVENVTEADVVVMGCPACGSEELDEDVVKPFVDSLEGKIEGKNIALFGSYGWGEGPWMEDWEAQVKGYKANLVAESVIALEAPDEEAKEKCINLGKSL